MTICHRTPAGQEQTLTLPRSAALAHLLRHPDDTVGACPVKPKPKPKPAPVPEVEG